MRNSILEPIVRMPIKSAAAVAATEEELGSSEVIAAD
jgi:hypothetical protein